MARFYPQCWEYYAVKLGCRQLLKMVVPIKILKAVLCHAMAIKMP